MWIILRAFVSKKDLDFWRDAMDELQVALQVCSVVCGRSRT